jgi:hypothetical protein
VAKSEGQQSVRIGSTYVGTGSGGHILENVFNEKDLSTQAYMCYLSAAFAMLQHYVMSLKSLHRC